MTHPLHPIHGRRVGVPIAAGGEVVKPGAKPPAPSKPPAPPAPVRVTRIEGGEQLQDLPPVDVASDQPRRLLAADPKRREVRLANLGTEPVYIGGPGVTKASALGIMPGYMYPEQTAPGAELWAIADAGNQKLAIQVVL